MTQSRISLPQDQLSLFCRQWKIAEFALFGSVLRDDFRPDSDIDVLVTFSPDASWSLFDHVEMRDELAAILGRKVDLLTRNAVEQSRNPIRRRAILESAEVIHAAA
ncbi:MAG: nucleotidyltransferase family protein [Sulfurimicrobium sp.]|nr:nucleotidyltransferase family protein [Sulfurimicrobium sp.]